MSPAELLAYLGPAVLLGALSGVFIAGALRASGLAVDPRHALTLCLAAIFLVLTQYPLPDPATLDCSTGGVEPILRPFATVDHLVRLWRYSQTHPDPLGLWLGNKVVQAAAMNFALWVAIGAAYARHDTGRGSVWRLLALASALSLGAELAQLSGLFGLYPCAWRTFETDDLILNISGGLAGMTLMRVWRRRVATP